MSNVFFISDLHLGHEKILEFSPRRGGTNVIEHSEWLVNQWNKRVGKKDIVYVLGDVCFKKGHLHYLVQMNGKKNLILGNHDEFPISTYQIYFNKIHGITKYKGFWLSHAPVHPNELRRKMNIHGHVHNNTIRRASDGFLDRRYINVSVENLEDGMPISLDECISYRNFFNFHGTFNDLDLDYVVPY